MNECVTMKDEIKTLIKKGKLAKYKCYGNQGVRGITFYLNLDEDDYVLREIHEGIYGSHLIGVAITLKAM